MYDSIIIIILLAQGSNFG